MSNADEQNRAPNSPGSPMVLRFYTNNQGWVDVDPNIPLAQQPISQSWYAGQPSDTPVAPRTFMETTSLPDKHKPDAPGVFFLPAVDPSNNPELEHRLRTPSAECEAASNIGFSSALACSTPVPQANPPSPPRKVIFKIGCSTSSECCEPSRFAFQTAAEFTSSVTLPDMCSRCFYSTCSPSYLEGGSMPESYSQPPKPPTWYWYSLPELPTQRSPTPGSPNHGNNQSNTLLFGIA